jgi:hypothetical protein
MRSLRLGILVLSPILLGQEATLPSKPDPADLVQHFAGKERANKRALDTYGHREIEIEQLVDKAGKDDGKPVSGTWDVIAVEGRPYRRLVMRNDQPLSAKEKDREDARQAATATARRQGKADPKGPTEVTIEAELLARSHVFSLAGEELVNGRRTWVLAGVPKTKHEWPTSVPKDYAAYHARVWVDADEFAVPRMEVEVVGGQALLKKGSTVRTVSARNEEGVWLPLEAHVKYDVMFHRLVRISTQGRVDVTYSNYHRMD